MTRYQNIKGIIFRSFNSGDADKVIYVINEDGQKIAMLAKGARKPGSRKSSSIELGNYVKIKAVNGYKLPIISEIQVINNFKHWKESVENSFFLQLFCELIDKSTFEDVKDERLYSNFLEILENENTEERSFIAAAFILIILEITGHLPELERDTPESFWETEGMVNDGARRVSFSERIFKTQKFISKTLDINQALRINLTPEEKEKMLKLHVEWLENILEKELKSKKIIYSIL